MRISGSCLLIGKDLEFVFGHFLLKKEEEKKEEKCKKIKVKNNLKKNNQKNTHKKARGNQCDLNSNHRVMTDR